MQNRFVCVMYSTSKQKIHCLAANAASLKVIWCYIIHQHHLPLSVNFFHPSHLLFSLRVHSALPWYSLNYSLHWVPLCPHKLSFTSSRTQSSLLWFNERNCYEQIYSGLIAFQASGRMPISLAGWRMPRCRSKNPTASPSCTTCVPNKSCTNIWSTSLLSKEPNKC